MVGVRPYRSVLRVYTQRIVGVRPYWTGQVSRARARTHTHTSVCGELASQSKSGQQQTNNRVMSPSARVSNWAASIARPPSPSSAPPSSPCSAQESRRDRASLTCRRIETGRLTSSADCVRSRRWNWAAAPGALRAVRISPAPDKSRRRLQWLFESLAASACVSRRAISAWTWLTVTSAPPVHACAREGQCTGVSPEALQRWDMHRAGAHQQNAHPLGIAGM